MCKHCALKTVNEKIGEKTTDGKSIGRIKDGSQIIDLYLNRYIIEKDNVRKNNLVLDLSFDLDGNEFIVKDKYIKIKYCPFCGEEL